MVGLGLVDGLDGLRRVGAHGHLRHVDVAVVHGQLRERLLLDVLAVGGELRHLAQVGGLGGLTAGVGVDLGVKDKDVDVGAGGEHVVETAVADVVGPAVAAKDPEALLGHELLVGEDHVHDLGAIELLELGHVGGSGGLVGLGVIAGVEPRLGGRLELCGGHGGLHELEGVLGDPRAHGLVPQQHAIAVLGVVLKERVVPGRAVTFGVGGVGSGRGGVAPDRGATGGVGHKHAVAKELRHQAGVAGLGAAGAGAGELKQRLGKLAELDVGLDQVALLGDVGLAVVEDLLLVELLADVDHGERALGALADADAAAHAVERGDGQRVLGGVGALGAEKFEQVGALGSSRSLLVGQRVGPDGGVRADVGAAVALDALGLIPVRDLDAHAALLVGRGAQLPLAVGVVHEDRDGQAVAVHAAHRLHDGAHLLDQLGPADESLGLGVGGGVGPAGGHVDLDQGGSAHLDGLVVLIDHVLALLEVGVGGGVLHVLEGVLLGQDLGQREEGGLQDGVGALAHPHLDRQVDGVDGVELDVVLGDVALGLGVEVALELVHAPLAVDEQGAAGLDVLDDGEALDDVRGVVAGHEVGLVDVVAAADGGVAKAQVADGHAAGLLGVVLEVGLHVLVGVVADDLDGVLVGADRAVSAQAPELALDGAGGGGAGAVGVLGETQVGDVVDDAHRELLLGVVLLELGEDGEGRGRRGVLGAEAVAAAHDLDLPEHPELGQGGDDVLVEGLAHGAGLLGAVHDGDLPDRLGQRGGELLGHEGAVEANLDQADLLAAGVEVVDDLLDHVAEGAHGHDHAVGVRGAVVVEELVVGADAVVDLVHVVLDDGRQGVVVAVAGLAVLEEDVAVLMGTAGGGLLGVQGVVAEGLDRLPVDHVGQLVIVPAGHLLDLVRGAESVEEVEERHAALDGREVRHRGEVHDLLDVALGEHREAGLAAGHDVGVVAEDVERLGGHGARAHVEHGRQLLGGDLVHVGDHQEQALGGGVRGGQRACGERAVDRAGGSALRLHLGHLDRSPVDVLAALGRPLVDVVGHGAGGGDGVDARHLGKGVRDVRCGVVAVHRLERSGHMSPPRESIHWRAARRPAVQRDGMRAQGHSPLFSH